MMRPRLFGLMCLLFASLPLAAQVPPFEGQYSVEWMPLRNGQPTDQPPVRMSYFLTADRLAIHPEEKDRSWVMICDFEKRQFINKVEVDSQRQATTTPLVVLPAGLPTQSSGKGTDDAIRATGRDSMLLGYACLQYQVESETERVELWVAPDLQLDYRRITRVVRIPNVLATPLEASTYGLNGSILLAHNLPQKGKKGSMYRVSEIRPGPIEGDVFSLFGYRINKASEPPNRRY